MHRGKGMRFVTDSRIKEREHRMENIPKDYSEYPGKTEAFFPNYLLKEWVVGAVFLIGFLCLTVAHPAPLEREADPMDSSYIPLPDWFFLFLYQLLKYQFAAGDYVVIGTVVLPGLAFGALMLAPWLDKGPERNLSKRPIATSMMILAVMSVVYLTWESADQHDWEADAEQAAMGEEDILEVEEDIEGYEIYQAQGCISCHGDNMEGNPGVRGPDLYELPYDAEGVAEISVDGIGEMPPDMFDGSEEELQILSEYVADGGGVNEELEYLDEDEVDADDASDLGEEDDEDDAEEEAQ
ncbi:menaquinol-cytochrome c reductase cytochrome b/c subunit [Natribacillus halophilus]|uniref:Menaquinol-cytochrome c reductase cytochrome b/c subunit n=1 Tax=Natribacillus halophilus TaxID=549003 RepID=A0A1G8JAW8_9BACI|nr:menaquinol-cytochrome c reductase cytochrome b/c subunit [Natribacillus halophilus]SDI28418.1 menaquinol-cytochrome c reductase cytochrome b/c subunit [Natribacillus halophilus]